MKKMFVLLFSLIFLVGCGTPSGGGQSTQDQLNLRSSARVHTELAGMYYERAQMGVALGEIEAALQADKNYAPAYSVRGLIRMALREFKEAGEDFQQSLRLDGNNSETHNNYGWFLCQHGKEKESIAHFVMALKNPLYGTPERACLNAGLCARKAGNNRDAEEFLQRALQLQPDMPQALLAMAELSFDKGDYVSARQYLVKFSDKPDSLTAEQLWLAVRIERKIGNHNAEASYAMQLRKRFPDATETSILMQGK